MKTKLYIPVTESVQNQLFKLLSSRWYASLY